MARMGILIALTVAAGLSARDLPEPALPVNVVVTVTGQKGAAAPQLTVDDILVSQNKQRLEVTGLEPLRAQSGRQLWVLIDDGATTYFGSQLSDLKSFVLNQPADTQIGLGYLNYGRVQVAEPLTTDHERVAKAMRIPTGMPGISASPYIALSDLIKKWPASNGPREVLMITSGIDPEYGAGPDDPYLNEAIDHAQKAGVVVYAIYYSGAGAWGHNYRLLFWGQNYLAQLTDETGGELFWLGTTNPVSLSPYLSDLSQRMDGQYLLTFLARPENKPGFQSVKIQTEKPHVKVSGPSRVFVQ